MSADVGRLREELYEWCGNDKVCRRAADYYIAVLKNPCYPPAVRRSKYYEKIVEKYGPPPRCDVKELVLERLRGTVLEKYAGEIAELAELIRRRLHTRSRTAAAVATAIVAERRGYVVVYKYVAARFGVADNVLRMWLLRARKLYADVTAVSDAGGGR